MAIPKRNARIPGTYFVTSSTWQRRSIFVGERAFELFVDCVFKYRTQGAYKIYAFVLMPDHFHLILTPKGGTALERAVQFVKGGSAHAIGKELAFKFPVWQKGFSDHRLRDAADFATHLRYLVLNPVKRGLVSSPEEYAWTSASGRFPMVPQRLKPASQADFVGTPEGVP